MPPATITLDGGGSSDSDGSIVSYSWNQILGSPIQLAQPDSQIIQFDTSVFSTAQFLVFELSVTDDDSAVSTDRVSVVVRPINPSGDLVIVWNDNLIIRELGANELVPGSLFDLEGKTLRFTPEGPGFRGQSVPFQWDPDFGSALTAPGSDSAESGSVEVFLTNFDFPFSGISWDSFFVNLYGHITFTGPQEGFFDGGPTIFVPMRNYGEVMIANAPIVSPFFRPFSPSIDSLTAYAKELPDRIVITWEVRERDTFVRAAPGVNRFQAVLYNTGDIDFSYESIAVRDGVVGVFGIGAAQEIAAIEDPNDANLPPYLDIVNVAVFLVGNHLRFDLTFRGDVIPEGDPAVEGVDYRIHVDLDGPFADEIDPEDFNGGVFWRILGSPELTYDTFGRGVSPEVVINGNTISLTAELDALDGRTSFAFFILATKDGPFDETNPIRVDLPTDPFERDLSDISNAAPARKVIYEEFYYPDIPARTALICSVIETFGDEFDFVALYTDFRIDRTRPTSRFERINIDVTGLGPIGGAAPELYCSDGRFLGLQDTAWIGASRFAENANLSGANVVSNYQHHRALLAHEIGHLWMAWGNASIAGQRVEIGGGLHWVSSLHAPVPFRAPDNQAASIMGGSNIQDNGDGTFTGLPCSGDCGVNILRFTQPGYSYLDLYLMGFLAPQDVPDFFVIQNAELLENGDASGNRINLTIDNFIAENGPRSPSFDTSQKDFNIGFVGIVQNGELPSLIMIERMAGIRQVWLEFWPTATGGVSTMTSTPNPPP